MNLLKKAVALTLFAVFVHVSYAAPTTAGGNGGGGNGSFCSTNLAACGEGYAEKVLTRKAQAPNITPTTDAGKTIANGGKTPGKPSGKPTGSQTPH